MVKPPDSTILAGSLNENIGTHNPENLGSKKGVPSFDPKCGVKTASIDSAANPLERGPSKHATHCGEHNKLFCWFQDAMAIVRPHVTRVCAVDVCFHQRSFAAGFFCSLWLCAVPLPQLVRLLTEFVRPRPGRQAHGRARLQCAQLGFGRLLFHLRRCSVSRTDWFFRRDLAQCFLLIEVSKTVLLHLSTQVDSDQLSRVVVCPLRMQDLQMAPEHPRRTSIARKVDSEHTRRNPFDIAGNVGSCKRP